MNSQQFQINYRDEIVHTHKKIYNLGQVNSLRNDRHILLNLMDVTREILFYFAKLKNRWKISKRKFCDSFCAYYEQVKIIISDILTPIEM